MDDYWTYMADIGQCFVDDLDVWIETGGILQGFGFYKDSGWMGTTQAAISIQM